MLMESLWKSKQLQCSAQDLYKVEPISILSWRWGRRLKRPPHPLNIYRQPVVAVREEIFFSGV